MKQKAIFNLFLLNVLSAIAFGQNVDYNKIILPESATNIRFEEKLVQIAYRNNPLGASIQKEVKIAAYDYKAARLQWTTLIGANGNLNEFSVKRFSEPDGTVGRGNLYFPRYNVYLHLPLSTFVTLPRDKKVAREKTAIADDKLKSYKLELRARVLKLYSVYQLHETIVKIRRTAALEEQTIYDAMEERFKRGNVTMEEYVRAQKSNNETKVQAAQAEALYQQSRIDLEEVIGIRLDEIR